MQVSLSTYARSSDLLGGWTLAMPTKVAVGADVLRSHRQMCRAPL